jgi:hypothetical protein
MEGAFGPTLQQLKELQENGFILGLKQFDVEIRVVSDMKALISVSYYAYSHLKGSWAITSQRLLLLSLVLSHQG